VITRCSAWVHLGNINYTGSTSSLQNTEPVYFGIKKSIEEKKGVNIEKYVEKILQIKIKNKLKKGSIGIRTYNLPRVCQML
jgi:hypothetical protein